MPSAVPFGSWRLPQPDISPASSSTQRTGRHAERLVADVQTEVRHEAGGELRRRNVGRRGELLSFAVAHEVAAPRDERSRVIHRAAEIVKATGPIEVVAHVVFTRPQQLDWLAD